mmetsp:Transcript_22453/g.34735  ORF Transcript_22453/g.34735 Transcript_22453/m.34735 type:complete len:88 (-) Transcript_22453:546-809(-)
MIMKRITFILTRIAAYVAGIMWIDIEYVSEGEGNYKKWLGPDWEPRWERTGAVISNHHCWMDTMLGLYTFFPSFVAKQSIKKYPFIR